MGQLEQGSKKRTRRANLEKVLLGTLVAAGGIGVALLAPNVLQLLKHVDPDWIYKRDPRQRLREVAHRLKKKGLAEFRTEGGKKRLRLTARGESVMSSIWSENFQLKKPRRWDGKWRLVIFDIPEKRRGVRDRIRTLVARLGFLRLQDSVWVYPYDCEDIIGLLKVDLHLGGSVIYLVVEKMENDKHLKKTFGLY